MNLRAYCLDCRHFHDCNPDSSIMKEMADWDYKHKGHRIEFSSKLDVEGFKRNTDFKLAFVASTDLTFTSLNSLASDTALLAGASAAAVDNGATGVPYEIGVSGYIKNSGSTPTVNREIDIYAYAALNDVPEWPDTLDGTDSTKTITTTNLLNSGLKLLQSMTIAATANQINAFAPVALSALFGVMPRKWSIFVVHNSGQAINSSGNKISYKGVYIQG